MSWAPPGSTSETHSGTPDGANRAWMLPPKPCALPEYHRSICLPFLLVLFSVHRSDATLRAPVGCDDFAVQDQVGQPLLLRLLQCLAQGWRSGCEHIDHLRQIPVGGG